jgi:hypothetical protein
LVQGEALIVADDSSCFYHTGKKAVVHCEQCGRFLCALCDVDMNGVHQCPVCIESGMKNGDFDHLQHEFVRYDYLALVVAGLSGTLLYMVSFIAAPVALYIAIRYWNKPLGILSVNRWRFIVAILISFCITALWVFIFVWIFLGAMDL